MNTRFHIVFLFSGQGSHYRAMGQPLFEHHPVFRQSLERSDAIVQKQLHRSLIDELYQVRQPEFSDLLVTHPAIVAVEIALFQVLQAMGIQPDYVSGNSLGEFAAGVASGVWSDEVAVEAAIEQAKSIVQSDVAGGMLAVIHPRQADLEQRYQRYQLYLASDNFSGHFTLTGAAPGLHAFQAELTAMGISFLRLPVNHPFHCPLIEEGRSGFAYYMASSATLAAPRAGFISSVHGQEVTSLESNYFWEAISRYSNFPQVITYMEKKAPCLYIDLGPSGTSATFVKYNLGPQSTSQTFPLMTPFKREREQLTKLQEQLREKIQQG